MKYAWKYGCTQTKGVSAQVVGEELEKLEKDNEGTLMPSTIVRAARPKKSKLHDCFEWDNKKAAEAHRENQARELMRKIVIVYEGKKKKESIRAFVNIKHDTESYYCHTKRIIVDETLHQNVVDEILKELNAIKAKYSKFQSPKLEKIWEAIEELELSLQENE